MPNPAGMRAAVMAAVVALLALGAGLPAGTGAAQAQSIEKVANKSLAGSAYARLRSLTYEQCQERCLKDAQCVAFEHFRGGGVIRRSSNCALFSSTRGARDSQNSDIGYKRGVETAAERPLAKRSARPEVPPGPSAGGSFAPPQPSTIPQRVPPPASTVAEQAERAQAEQARRANEERARLELDRLRRQAAESARARTGQVRGLDAAGAAPSGSAPSAEPRFSSGSGVASAPPPPPPPRPFAAPAPTTAPSSAPPPASLPKPGATTRSASPSAGVPEAGTTRGLSPVAAAPAAVPQPAAAPPDFHIVPVFFGTDRNRADTAKRIAYANDRARRLEMGQALITVPSNHKVPNIERPSAWTIPYFGKIWEEAEDPKKHFTMREIKALTKTELLDLVKKRLGGSEAFKNQSIVFIHGYNIGFDDALYRTAQISFDLQFDGATYSYSWPAGSGWASYPYARDSAQQAEQYLYEFLQMVQNETGTSSISIVAHSMGNQMLLQVLRSLKQRSPNVSKINQIVLAAPDVDRDAFEFLAGEIRGVAKGITLYAAGNDVALEASRYLAGNKPRAGDVPITGPVVVPGIDTIDISGVSTGYLSTNHSNYAEHSELLTDLKHLIRSGIRPPELRIASYRRIQAAQGIYWRYGN